MAWVEEIRKVKDRLIALFREDRNAIAFAVAKDRETGEWFVAIILLEDDPLTIKNFHNIRINEVLVKVTNVHNINIG